MGASVEQSKAEHQDIFERERKISLKEKELLKREQEHQLKVQRMERMETQQKETRMQILIGRKVQKMVLTTKKSKFDFKNGFFVDFKPWDFVLGISQKSIFFELLVKKWIVSFSNLRPWPHINQFRINSAVGFSPTCRL